MSSVTERSISVVDELKRDEDRIVGGLQLDDLDVRRLMDHSMVGCASGENEKYGCDDLAHSFAP